MDHTHHTDGLMSGIAPDHVPVLMAAGVLLVALAAGTLVLKHAGRTPGSRAAGLLRRLETTPIVTRVAALLLLVTAVTHLALVPNHGGEAPGLALAFLLNGLAFLALALAALFGWRWRKATAALLVATILAYLIAVGSGREDVDGVGVATKLVEVTALGLVLVPRGEDSRLRRGLRWSAMGGSVMAMGVLTGGVTWGAALRPHGHDQVSLPTPQQAATAARLAEATRAGIARYEDTSVAIAAGYHPGPLDGNAAVHWEHKTYGEDRDILDPSRPEQLVYVTTPSGPKLVGAVFVMPSPRVDGPEPGGPLTRWHTHHVCIAPLPPFLVSLVSPFGGCPGGSVSLVMPQMMHVWIVDNPNGPFAEELHPDVVRRLRKPAAAGAR